MTRRCIETLRRVLPVTTPSSLDCLTFHDRNRLLDLVERLTDRQEHGRARPWKVSDAPPGYTDTMLKGIVGVELAVTRIDGKWKASQNRSAPDQLGGIEGMREDGHQEMAEVMEGVKRPE